MKKRVDIFGIIAGLLELVVGILLLINPAGFTSGIIIAAGVILCALGIKFIVDYFRMSAVLAAKSRSLLKGLFCLLAGVFCIVKFRWFIETFPILTVIYGIFLLIFGLGKVQVMIDMIRMKIGKWFLAAISAVVTIAAAVVILMNPFASTAILWMFIGIALIVEAILDIVVAIIGRGNNNTIYYDDI